MTVWIRRRFTLTVAVVAAAGTLTGAVVAPGAVAAAPAPTAPGNEGGTPLLRDVLESTGRGFVQARSTLDKSQKRQLELTLELRNVENRIALLTPEIGEVASTAYRTGRVGPVMVLLNSNSPDEFIQRAQGLDLIAQRDDRKLRELNQAREQAARAKLAIDAEVAQQKKQLLIMDKQKKEAERALALVGGKSTGGFVVATSPVARQAPRNSDGSWPPQSCSQKDPTTSGCVTPRTLHALNEAKRAGFTRFVSCFRSGGPFEHPKGRACDFSPQKNGFGGDATGEAKIYGNNLTAFLVRNADKLGILYVIWYRQIWLPATGWKSYRGAFGDPSSDHTNHVHLSLL